MTPLAENIHRILYRRIPSADGRINYGAMILLLDPIHGIETPNDHRLNPAYAEIVEACHNHQPWLPALPAILVLLDDEGRLTEPGQGYYPIAHPGLSRDEARIAWARELELVRQTVYPEPEDLE